MSAPDPTPFLRELRREFDLAFARPEEDRSRAAGMALLGVGVRDLPLALPLEALASIDAGRVVEPLPGAAPGVLGLAGLRGQLVAVFDLAALLGLPGSGPAPRWFATIRRAPSIAVAFGRFEGRFDAAGPAPEVETSAPRVPFVSHHVRDGSTVRAVVDLDAVLSSLERAAGDPRQESSEEVR